ncbi:MAG TPA: PAS domain S-box protein [Allosphingosinicella sp.]|nr:PAS domain S-box protein [Allosphingosinicella sp.]
MADQLEFNRHVAEQRFQLLINAVTDFAIYMLEPTGHIATWNPGARRFKGYEAEEVIGRHFSTFFTEEDKAADLPGRILRTAAEEGRFESEGWRVRKDGTRFWAQVVVDPIRGEDGTLLGFAKITRDISERHARERALYESEQRFRMLVQGVRDIAIYMLDPDGRVSNWNPGAEAIKGYPADEIIGQHFSRFYTEEDRAAGEPDRALETAIREGKYEKEAWRVRKDGSHFWASVLIDPIFDDTGRLSGFAKITRDITDKKRAQDELEEARAALFQSQKLQALGELTGGIAHDFNNLITVVRGSAEMLKRSDLTPERRERYLDAIVETAERAAALTSHLLAFGRRQALKPQVIDLNVRLDALADVLGRMLGSHIEVKLDLAPDLWPVEADPAQLESALLNAAINARDAMPEGGTLTLQTSNVEQAAEVCVAVSDTGEGMSPEVLGRAFEPFFTTKSVGKGTGLGLSQIHGFAAQTGGRAEIESKQGLGTTVRILLPRTEKSPEAAEDGRRTAEGVGGKKILLVEDNDLVRRFAEGLLADLGYEVASTGSADEALARLGEERIDLVLTDIVMPGKSGIELARRINQDRPGLPVLLATGYSNELLEGAAAEFQVISKPYGPVELAEAVAAALGERGR